MTEQQTEALIELFVERIQFANVYFLKQIGSAVERIGKLSPTQAQQLIQILKYDGSYDEIVRQISKYTDLNVRDVKKVFEQYAKQDQLFSKQFYKYRNIPFVRYEDNEALKRQTRAMVAMVQNEMYNYMRTNVLGYSIRDPQGNLRFLGIREVYNSLLDTAYLNVGQGKETFNQALHRILKQIGHSGLKTVDYESGRSVRLDSAIRMHLRSRLRELHNENQKLFGEEFDSDGVEISVHLNPAPDHEGVQGRQFSTVKPNENELSEWEKLQAGEEAIDYKGNSYTLDHDHKNGYRPISEMNCYHYIFPIVLGVSEPEYSDQQLKQIIDSNGQGFELDGKHYTNYQGTQLQRRLETEIRKQKDIQILGRESGIEQTVRESQDAITRLTNKYNKLSKASGLPTKMQRMRVSGYHRVKVKQNTE